MSGYAYVSPRRLRQEELSRSTEHLAESLKRSKVASKTPVKQAWVGAPEGESPLFGSMGVPSPSLSPPR